MLQRQVGDIVINRIIESELPDFDAAQFFPQIAADQCAPHPPPLPPPAPPPPARPGARPRPRGGFVSAPKAPPPGPPSRGSCCSR